MNDIRKVFQDKFGVPPAHVVRAPGRLELLGNHTDYNEGLVLSIAVDRHLAMAAQPRNDGKIELISSAFPEREIFYADNLERNPAAPWANHVKGVLLQLRKRGVHFTGFSAAIHSTLPLGSGMGSSAALEVATALLVRKLFPYAITETGLRTPPIRNSKGDLPPLAKGEKLALAKLCQVAESEFVGANVGLLDQLSCLFGKTGQVMQIDCRHLTIGHTAMTPGTAVVVCDSGVPHDLSNAGGYNLLRAHCESAARTLGVPALRSVEARQLEAAQARLNRRDYECASHVVAENQRVVAGERALQAGDIDQFGAYLFQSHASSRDSFKNSCAELDTLVELARELPGCVGARLTGGGFGGATINLVRQPAVGSFLDAMIRGYGEKTGRQVQPSVCQIVEGAA